MKTRTSLFFFFGLVAGIFLGAWAGRDSKSSSDRNTVSASPRFGDKTPSTSLAAKKAADKNVFRTDMEEQFLGYSRMPSEEIAEELKKIDTANLDIATNKKTYTAMLFLGQRWGQIAPEQALLQCKKLKNIRNFLYSEILTGWANTNPEATAVYYMENRGDGEALFAATQGLVKAYPEKAWQWIDTLSENERKEALPVLLMELSASHPDQLPQAIQKLLPEAQTNADLRTVLVQEWIMIDRDAARKWMDSLPDSLKNKTLATAISGLASSDPDQAMQEFSTLDEDLQNQILPPMLESLSSQSPAKTMDWLLKNFPEEKSLPLLPAALGDRPPVSAQTREYVMQMNGGLVKDAALEHLIFLNLSNSLFANTLPPVLPEDTLELAARITDPGKQEQQRIQILQKWLEESPAKATEWIKQSDFSTQQKQSYMELESSGMSILPYIPSI